MKKLLLLCLVLLGGVMQVSAQIAESGKITVYFQNTQNWTGPFYIYFEKGNDHYGYDWPGKPAETTTIDGVTWYYRTETLSSDKTGFVAKFNNNGSNEASWNNVWYDVYATINSSNATERYNTYFLYNTVTHLSVRLDNNGTAVYSTTIDNQTSPSDQDFVVANIAAYKYTTTIQSDKWNSDDVIRPYGAQNNTPVNFETLEYTQGWSNNSSGSWLISSSKPGYYTFNFKTDNTYAIAPYFTRTLPAAAQGYATFSSTYDVIPDANLTAVQYASAVNTTTGEITWASFPATGIKAGEGALLTGTAGETYTFTPASSAVATGGNCLIAIDTKTKIAQHPDASHTNFILAKPGTHVGFYKVNDNGSWCGAGTAYLSVPSGSLAREFFALDGGETNGINAIDNGQLTIDNNAPMYNLAGQRVNKSYKGVVIVNGKKMLNK